MQTPDSPFSRLRDALGPTEEQRARMLAKVRENMTSARDLRAVRSALEPEEGARIRVWNRVRERIAPSRARGLLEQVRTYLTPEHGGVFRMNAAFLPRLQPVAVPARPLKWVAAFAVVIVALRVSPLLFLAPQTVAESSVFLRPTRGDVSISLDGLMQPVDRELTLLHSSTIHTADGEATILLHDDGTIRLASHTSLTLQDLTDRPQKGSGLATLTLASGTVWVQGLVPDHLRGLSVVTPAGTVTVHGGSVSVTVRDGGVTVESWDRHARFEREGQADVVLVSGERLVARDGALRIEQMEDHEFDGEWPSQNLQRDAVHQRAVAQQQRERIAARAGILPTSRLYPVKRIAEEVDVLLTFDRETAVKKRIAQATTRLNEATTLIAGGESGAIVPLKEYQDAVLGLAQGSGDTLARELVEQGVAENAAQLGAQLPDDDVYVVKRVVLTTSTQLPVPPIDASDVEASVISDAVEALQIATVEGDEESLQEQLETLAPYIEDLPDDPDIDPVTKKEVVSQLSRVADALRDDANATGGTGAVALRAMSRAVRTHAPVDPPRPVPLTEEQIRVLVDGILDRVFVYSQYTGQTNQLRQEILKLKDHSDEGSILRELHEQLSAYEDVNSDRLDRSSPDFRLTTLVRAAIQDLRERRELID